MAWAAPDPYERINDQAKAQEILAQIIETLRTSLGLTVSRPVDMLLVDAAELDTVFGGTHPPRRKPPSTDPTTVTGSCMSPAIGAATSAQA